MTMRQVIRLGAFALLALFLGIGCSSSSSPTGPSHPSTSHTFISSTVSGHSHSIAIAKSEIDSPPSSGISRSTSTTAGHSHNFSMTEAQLLNVQGGGTEVISTSTVNGHFHTFTITKWY